MTIFSEPVPDETPEELRSYLQRLVDVINAAQDRLEEPESEPWHNVGTPGEPAFQNGWTNHQANDKELLAFRKHGHHLELKGYVLPGTISEGIVLFTLPVGYRPHREIEVVSSAHNPTDKVKAYSVEIYADGRVSLHGLPSNTYTASMHIMVHLDNNGD